MQFGFLGRFNPTTIKRGEERAQGENTGWNSGKDGHSGSRERDVAPSPPPTGRS